LILKKSNDLQFGMDWVSLNKNGSISWWCLTCFFPQEKMSISSCNELCSIKFSSFYWVLILYYIHALISGIDNHSSLRGYAIEVAKCSRCLPEFSITRYERFLGSRIWPDPSCPLVIKFNISAVYLHVFDTALVRTRYLMGRATLKGRFWVQLLSEPLLSSSAGWKMLDLRRTCFCLQLFFSRFDLD
jgi:hypothetical protein